jgi:hypothetical protein
LPRFFHKQKKIHPHGNPHRSLSRMRTKMYVRLHFLKRERISYIKRLHLLPIVWTLRKTVKKKSHKTLSKFQNSKTIEDLLFIGGENPHNTSPIHFLLKKPITIHQTNINLFFYFLFQYQQSAIKQKQNPSYIKKKKKKKKNLKQKKH